MVVIAGNNHSKHDTTQEWQAFLHFTIYNGVLAKMYVSFYIVFVLIG